MLCGSGFGIGFSLAGKFVPRCTLRFATTMVGSMLPNYVTKIPLDRFLPFSTLRMRDRYETGRHETEVAVVRIASV